MTPFTRKLTLTALCAALCSPAIQAAGYTGLGANSVSKETLEQFRPRPLDAALSRRIQSMLDISAPGGGLLSPDAKQLFFTWRVTGVSQIWRIDGPQRFPVQLTGGEDATTLADITPDGRYLLVQRDRKGEENPGLYLQPTEGGALIEIQHKEGVQTFHQFVSRDSRYVYYAANDIRPDSRALYRYEIASGRKEAIFTEPGLWAIADHLDDGRLLLEKGIGSAHSEYYEWQSGKLTPVIGQNDNEEYEMRFGVKPGEYLVQTPRFGNFRRLYRYTGGQFDAITPELNWDVSGFQIDDTRSRILYTVNDNGYSTLHALDARSGKPLALPAFKEADHVLPGSSTRDGRYSVLIVETAQAPRSAYVYDWRQGKQTQWVLPSSPEVDTRRFARASLETYPARDGTPIPMFVRRPASCSPAPCPVIVHFHGGPESQTTPGFSPYAQLFVDAGYIFAEPNVRGSDGYGKTWFHADDGAKRLDVITDIEDAARYIRSHWGKGGVAPKIGIMGGSYGGYSTLVGMTMFAGSFDAGVANVGMSNLLTFLNNTAPYRRKLRTSEYGDPETDREALIKLSPVSYIDKLSAPLLIIQGASDPRVPVGEAVQMYEAAKQKGVPSELMIFADEGHGAQKRENRLYTIGHTLRFFDQALKPRP